MRSNTSEIHTFLCFRIFGLFRKNEVFRSVPARNRMKVQQKIQFLKSVYLLKIKKKKK